MMSDEPFKCLVCGGVCESHASGVFVDTPKRVDGKLCPFYGEWLCSGKCRRVFEEMISGDESG